MVKALLALLFGGWVLATHAAEELIFGVYPYLSPSQTVEQFAPLRDYLAKALDRPVALRSAPNFGEFIERTRRGEYDVVFTAPHMGRLAEKRDGYRRVAQTGYQIVVALVCRGDSPIRSIGDLKGRSVAIGAKLSMTYQLVEQALNANGLSLGRDVTPVLTAGFSNVMEATLRGEADAGAIPTAVLSNIPAEQRAGIRELLRTAATPGILVMAHPRLAADMLERFRGAILKVGQHPDGRLFLERSKLVDFLPLDEATMKRIDPFTAVLEAQ